MKLDEPTANLSRPGVARIYVEMDLLKELLAIIWIGIGVGKGFWQFVLYEDLPPYCSHCKKVRHDYSNCKKLLFVWLAEKDGVDPIAARKEHKQHDAPAFSGGNKRMTWAPKGKELLAPATVLLQSSLSTKVQIVSESIEALVAPVSNSVEN